MLKETMTYVDYDGIERTEDFYFNLDEAEIMEMELSTEGGLSGKLDRLVKAKDQVGVIKTFKEVILQAYGEKSPDGKYFRKSEELSKAFSQTRAYSQLFMKLATDSAAGARFVNGIMPADLAKKAAALPAPTIN